MAIRGKKKTQARGTAQTPAAQVAVRKPDVRWAYAMAVVLVLLTVFLFINSFTIQADIEYVDDDGNDLLADLDSSELAFGKSAITVIFAPVDGYDGAIDYTLKNLPLSKDSELVQDIAKELVSSYPAEKLELLDTAYITIYVTEAAYLAFSLAFAALAIIVLVRRKNGDDIISLIAVSAMTALSAARLIIGLVMCLSSTKEFMITAGGAPWLALVVCAAATVVLAIFVADRIKKDKKNKAEKVR